MRPAPWCAVVLLVAVGSPGCGEDDLFTAPPAGQQLVASARARFKLLDRLMEGGLEFQQVDGGFQPVAPPRRGQRGGAWRGPGQHRLMAEYPARAGGVTRLSSGPVTLELRSVGARDVAGATAGRAMVYPGAFEGADSIHVAQHQRVEEFFWLHDAGARRRFEYELKVVRGGGQARQRHGVVEVLDRHGIAWLRLDQAYVVDSDGARHHVPATLRGARLTVRVPEGLGQYPLLLDPGWSTTGYMMADRADADMLRLKSGKVLVAGGWPGKGLIHGSAELFDPATGTWTTTGTMVIGREDHVLCLLPKSGKALAVGGMSKWSTLGLAELYDPATGKWTKTGYMSKPREDHTATVLSSGQVLAVGGRDKWGVHASAELYDPATGKWAATGTISTGRRYHTATLLPGAGVVLVTGGTAPGGATLNSATLYHPKTDKWAPTGSMTAARAHHTATLLASGQVLVVGGDSQSSYLASAELYDPTTGQWKATGGLAGKRRYHASVLLNSGKVLVVGGQSTGGKELSSAELFDPATQSFSAAGDLARERSSLAAALLGSGQVLVAGGKDALGDTLNSAELYDATTGQACASGGTCHSGHCADGICCESACAEPCMECVADSSKQGTTGKCVFVQQGKLDPSATLPCVGAKICDGAGNCRNPQGAACAAASDCAGTPSRVVIPLGSSWRYHDKGTDLGTTWLAAGFSDSGWGSGPAQLGYGDSDEATVLQKPAKRHPSVYFRKKITLDATPNAAQLTLLYDDGGAVWINGALVFSINTGHGTKYDAWASNESADNATLTVKLKQTAAKGPLKTGENIVAVMIKQASDSSSDTSFDLALKIWGTAGRCVDGYCCDKPCAGTCQGCNVPGKLGSCSLVPSAAPDPSAKPPCTGAKACDGKGQCLVAEGNKCAKFSDCISGYCQDQICCDKGCSATCYSCGNPGKLGSCSPIPAGKEDLGAASPCTNGFACDGKGGCKQVNGLPCTAGGQCVTGNCVDGYCCHSACGETCRSCGLKGSLGICTAMGNGKQDKSATKPCTGDRVCDLTGGCVTKAGMACNNGSECLSGFCADKVCCDSKCTKECHACDLAGNKGICSPVLVGHTDPSAAKPCVGSATCDGKGNCLAALGQQCGLDKECASDRCVDQVCCNSACNKRCQSCKLSGHVGTCTPHPTQTDPENDCIGTDAKCGGLCDGSGACVFPSTGTLCGKSPCMACDGTGRCDKAPLDDSRCGAIDCDKLDTNCKDYHDLSDLRCQSLGLCKEANTPQSCAKYSALKCSDAGGDQGRADASAWPDHSGGADSGGASAEQGGCGCGLTRDASAEGYGLLLPVLMLVLCALARSRRRINPS